jgi:hypothetical protein
MASCLVYERRDGRVSVVVYGKVTVGPLADHGTVKGISKPLPDMFAALEWIEGARKHWGLPDIPDQPKIIKSRALTGKGEGQDG